MATDDDWLTHVFKELTTAEILQEFNFDMEVRILPQCFLSSLV